MIYRHRILIALTALAILTVGCQTAGQGSKTYTRDQAQTPMQVYTGTILKIADVQIQRDRTGVGAAGGGVAQVYVEEHRVQRAGLALAGHAWLGLH